MYKLRFDDVARNRDLKCQCFSLCSQFEPIVLVHGGAGDIPDSRDHGKLIGCKLAAQRGFEKLSTGGSVLDAVEAAVRSMELDENFNAGSIEIKQTLPFALNK